ncbi:MAG: TadE/TadG family type IV pilus assembly protein [Dehalococcoidia bacterium]
MTRRRSPSKVRTQPLAANQAGQAIVWVAVMLPLFLAVVGLAIDGGVVFSARRELQNVADAGARAGAMQVDQRLYRESSGATVVLDPAEAREVAAAYVAGEGAGLETSVVVQPQRVVVQVSREVPTTFIRLVGIDSVRVQATAPAEVRYGIERATR